MLTVLLSLFSTSLKAQETAYYWYVGWTLPTSLEELKTLAVESESSHGGSITEISSEKLLTNSSEIRNSSNAHYYVVIPVGYDIYDATLPNTPITNNSFTEVTDIVIANHEIYKSNDGARSNSGLEIYEATKYYWYVGTSIPAELNGAVSNPETDKWVEIGTEIPSYIKVTTASDYSFPTWYVVMPTSFQFRPHDGGGIDDESSVWEISFSSIDGYTLYTVKDETSEIQSVFKKRGSLPYKADADYWYLGQSDPSVMTEISPISVYNWASVSDSWEEILDPSKEFELNKQPNDWDYDSFTALWYVAIPASSGYTPQDADLWETSTATIAGKEYIVYKSEGKVWELNTAFLPEEYVEENPEPETAYYWYLGTEKLLTDEDVEAKGVQISDKSEITTLTWESAEYVYFIYPKEFGIAKIVDEGGDDAGGKAVEKLSNVNLEKYTGWRFNKYSQGMVCSISFTEPAYTVSLSHTNITLTVGESVTLTATVTPEDATTESMWWEVYNTNIATVEDGVVTAVVEGSTRIIVHVGDYFAACQVTVEAADTPEPKSYWYVGVTDPRTLTPDNVGNEILDQWTEFTTEKESPVSVSKQDPEYNAHIWYIAAPYDWKYTLYNATGAASSEAAYKMYSAMIDGVRYKVWEGKGEAWQAVGQLTIANHVPITALSVEQSSITMTVGDVATVNVTKTPEDATVPNWQIAWTSSNEDVVFVSGGELHACAPGKAIITITDTDFYGNGASVSFEVIVEAAAEPEPYVTEFEQGGIHYIFLEKYVANDELGAWVTSTNGWFVGEENTYSGDIVVPSTVTYGGKEYPVMGICDEAFERCTVNSITLSEGIIYVSPKAFKETMLGALYLPSTFRMWDNFFIDEVNGYMLLQGCIGLETLVVSSEHPIYDSRDNCNAIIETATNTLIEGCEGTVIPTSVTTLGPTAFMGRDIVELIIPEGVKEVKGRVFDGCKNLQRVVFPSSVEVIKGNMLFYGCSSLTSVEIPQTALIRSAENHEESFETPGSMVIPSYMFSECTALQEFAIPNNVTSIGSGAFFMCKNLEAITIPESVTAIGDLTFYDCDNMTEVTLLGQTPPAVLVDAFNEAQYKQITLNVPEGAEEAYKLHEVWGKFFNEPEPEPTPAPASVAFTFTRGADVAVNVEGIEGVTASIEAAPATYLTTAAAANDSILCINQNTSTATADNPNKYTLTITNNSGVDLAFDYINVCGVALTSTGNFQGVRTVRDRVFVVSYGDNILAPATMRICDDSHCSGVATVNTFEAVDAIPASSTYVIGVSIYTDGGAGCFYGLTRITLGKNEPEGGDVTNIESPVLEAQDSQLIYDLQGRRVTHPTKGIYIVGGKKVIMK